ncbi:MAG: c-type cytochrome [Variibacter sp.]|nr:c-type cytochrome [Variibacter sp.]
MGAKRAAFAVLSLVAAMPAQAQTPAQSPAPPPGATSCSGCHPPAPVAGIAVPPLRGRAPEEIVAAVRQFRSGERPGTLMDRIAKGFTDDEVRAIAAWYAAQR